MFIVASEKHLGPLLFPVVMSGLTGAYLALIIDAWLQIDYPENKCTPTKNLDQHLQRTKLSIQTVSDMEKGLKLAFVFVDMFVLLHGGTKYSF